MLNSKYFLFLFVMAIVTYAVRAVPLLLIRKKIEHPFFNSFLTYIPYTVLGAMTFPAILTSTGQVLPSSMGCLVALILAYRNKGLVTVAVFACLCALLTGLIQW